VLVTHPKKQNWLQQVDYAAASFEALHEVLVAQGATVVHDEYTLPPMTPIELLYLEMSMDEVNRRALAVQWADGRAKAPCDGWLPIVLAPTP
jgi:hypothetical protein